MKEAEIKDLQSQLKKRQATLRSLKTRLKNIQIGRISEEIKNLRESDLGQMLSVVNKSERAGKGFDAFNNQVDQMISMFTCGMD